MQIQISTQHFDLTDAVKTYINEKVARLDKYGYDDLQLRVHLIIEASIYRCNIQVGEAKGERFYAESENKENMHKAVDEVVEKLEKQLRRNKN